MDVFTTLIADGFAGMCVCKTYQTQTFKDSIWHAHEKYVSKEMQPISRGVKLIFTGGHISLEVAFKGLNVILGLYKCNYSLTVKREISSATK